MITNQYPSKLHSDLINRARAVFPGLTNNAVSPKPGQEIIADRGTGPYLYDVDGRQWLDFALGSGPLIHGHAHPRMVETIKQTCELGSHHFIPHKRTVELAERICTYVPCAEMVRFAKNGSDATSGAVRVARAYSGRDIIACCG